MIFGVYLGSVWTVKLHTEIINGKLATWGEENQTISTDSDLNFLLCFYLTVFDLLANSFFKFDI